MSKKLYYEVLEGEDGGEHKEESAESRSDVISADAVMFERDRYAELMSAASKIEKVRFRVSPDYGGSDGTVALFVSIVVVVGGIFMLYSKSNVGKIVIGALLIAAIGVGAAAMILSAVKSRRVWYCYYVKTESGVFCMSAIDDEATVFSNGVAYRISGETFVTLDETGYADFLDGEGCGIFSILRAGREDVEFYDDDVCFVKNRVGGGHTVYMESGKIVRIDSEVPHYTDETDARTGERKVKTKTYVKTDPDDTFSWEAPEYVKRVIEERGIELPAM